MPEHASQSNSSRSTSANRFLVVLGLALTVTIFICGGLVILEARQRAWSQAETSSENLMLALRRDLSRNLRLLDLSLQGTQEALATPGIDAVAPNIFQHAVFDRSASAEDVASFLVLDATGKITHHANSLAVPDVNLGDRDYFKAHADDPNLGVFFSSVYRSRLRGGAPSIAMTRRLNTPDGRFAGIVLGAIETSYFERLFQNLNVGPNGSITLLTTAGRVVHRQPLREADVNRDMSGAPTVRRMLSADQGQFVGTASLDGVSRLYTFSRVGDLPLIIAVNMSLDDIYADWRTQAWQSEAILAILCLATLTLTLLFYREVERRSAAEAALIESSRQLSIVAATDGLTGLGNRRTMDSEIDREWKRAVRAGSPISLLMIDVDHFKLFNDRYGHPEGDTVLSAVARCLQESAMRAADSVSRYGGEEFVALLPDTDAAGASATAERARAAVEALQIPHESAPRGFISVSIGASVTYPEIYDRKADLLKAADLALYQAKQAGRNCVAFQASGLNRSKQFLPALSPQGQLIT